MRLSSKFSQKVEEASTFGNDWTEFVEECAMPEPIYGDLPTKGITNS